MSKKVNAMEVISKGGYPEVGYFKEKKDLQKFYKQLDTAMLEDWCKVEGLEYKPCEDNDSIHRMRVAMAILYKHFPNAPAKAKSKAKYADYTTEALMQLALDNDIAFEPCEDDRILRMRAIMSLRANKIIE